MKPEKPKFPNPRLIREDFLPYEPMKNYRIKKVIYGGQPLYYPQKKVLWWWVDTDLNGFNYFYELETAKKAIRDVNTVEYIYDFDL